MHTRIEVSGDAGRPTCLLRVGALAPRRLRSRDGVLRIGLVAAQALLLAGDDVRIEVVVDGPHRVDVARSAAPSPTTCAAAGPAGTST